MAKRKPGRRAAAAPSSKTGGKSRSAASRRTSATSARPQARRTAAAKRTKPAARKVTAKAMKAAARKPVKATRKPVKAARKPARKAAAAGKAPASASASKRPRIDRQRRTLDETMQTPPSSLDMERHGTAARSGRAAMRKSLQDHPGMPELTAGDADGDWENAYFSGEEAPGGDNPTPDQNVVEDIGKALGVEYDDAEELKASDKVAKRDEHRWELDPASSEDYKDRD
jgi:hypothetical protein